MTSERTTWVGLDVHKRSIAIFVLPPNGQEAVGWQEANEPVAIRRLARRLRRQAPDEIRCCYEAGPTGYALQRQLIAEEIPCQVVAPSLIPVKPGSRVKTDHRDARKLAELLRAGLLTEVRPPTAEEEAVRDLCRCREDAQQDLIRAKHRLSKFLLRRHCVFDASKHMWGTRHLAWLHSLSFDDPASQATFESYLLAVDQLQERVHQLETKLAEVAVQQPYRVPVAWLRCFRGIDTVTAVSLVAELHGFERFRSPRALMAYLGLVPCEYSSGETHHQGAITKAGNNHVRRLLIEAAWHHRHRPAVGFPLRKRREGQPTRVIAIADRAQQRLYRRWVRMTMRGKPHNKVVVAVARELVGYLWATLHPLALTPRVDGC